MKCLLVDVKVVEKDGISTCWCGFVKLARERSDGKLYHFSKAEILQMYPVEKIRNPELFAKLTTQKPGTLVDLEYAVNDFGKAVMKDIKVIKPSPYTYDELFK